jgi:hypothetical protein
MAPSVPRGVPMKRLASVPSSKLNMLLVALSAYIAVASPGLGGTGSAARPPRLLALIVVDTDINLKPHVEKDRDNFRRVLSDAFATRPHRLVLEVFEGTVATRQRVLGYYEALSGKVRPDDTLLFYYSGHGATYPQSGGHAMTLHHGDGPRQRALFRAEVRQAMIGLNARHAVLLTDCCSKIPESVKAKIVREPPKASWPLIDILFFHHRGLTEINGCQEDALSWCYSDRQGEKGSTFTLALVPLLCTKKEDFVAVFGSDDGFVTWSQFERKLRPDTDRLYQEVRKRILELPHNSDGIRELQAEALKQDRQDPQVVSEAGKDPQEIVDKTWMLGIEYTSATKGRSPVVYVVKVYPNTPAQKAGILVGDVVSSVNGVRVTQPRQVELLLEHSDGQARIEYFRNGSVTTVDVKLAHVKPPASS